MSDQYLRKCSLVVSQGADALDLSALRIRFETVAADSDAPNTARIRVYNLADSTVNKITAEYQRVTLQAGYLQGNFGVIFDGTIKQFVRGRESPVDSFLDILAAEGDKAFNFAFVSKTLAAGASPSDQAKVIGQSMSDQGTPLGDVDALSSTPAGGVLPRGKVLFGLGRERLSDLAVTTKTSWSIQDGKVTVIPLTGYLPGEAVVLNSRSGLIGIPEATADGLNVRCLLNPKLSVGTRIQINNAEINTPTIIQQGVTSYGDVNYVASVTLDGIYRVLVIQYTGDTRGQEWYADLTCLALDPSTPVNQSVKAYGGPM